MRLPLFIYLGMHEVFLRIYKKPQTLVSNYCQHWVLGGEEEEKTNFLPDPTNYSSQPFNIFKKNKQ